LSRPLGSGNTGGVEWVPPEPRLEAPGVALRPFRVSDAAAGADACRDPAILRFTFMEDDLTEAGAVDWINEATEWWSRGQPRFAIVDPDDDRLLGQVGLGVNSRHLSGDWGDLSDSDRRANDHAVRDGDRLLSSYQVTPDLKIWIVTEANREATTALLPDEY